MNSQQTSQTQSPAMASLYVGDLHHDVTEAQLYEKFSSCGPVLSIRVCRDMVTRKSLGYAYVNFQNPTDAEGALDNMNFDEIKGRPIRIMWSQRDPSLRKSGVGNIFIKNLAKDIEQKELYDTFIAFGNILSCKIASDENGKSKGYGFVHYEFEEDANSAIEGVHGMIINEKKVYVGKFIPKSERNLGDTIQKFTNCFVKNFADELDTEKLETLFSNYGEITSAKVMTDPNGKSKGFGFVCFRNSSSAEDAVKELNGHKIGEKAIYVARAQKKQERVEELRVKFEKKKLERTSTYATGVNLYVKNLDDSIDDDKLKDEFKNFGNITSAKVMTDSSGRSKGFGFVCFSCPGEAAKAVSEMNGKICGSKPLYVALAQRKDDRRTHLANQYIQRMTQSRNPNIANNQMITNISAQAAQQNAMNPYLLQHQIQHQRFYNPTQFMQGNRNQLLNQNRWTNQLAITQQPGSSYALHARQLNPNTIPLGQFNAQSLAGMQSQTDSQAISQQMRNMYMQQNQQSQLAQNMLSQRPVLLNQQNQNLQQAGARHVLPNNVIPPSGNGGLGSHRANAVPVPIRQATATRIQNEAIQNSGESNVSKMLIDANPEVQKQWLGENLFPKVEALQPSLAGKITGMLLEMENTELLHMLESTDSLRVKVDEAYNVLLNHKPSGKPGNNNSIASDNVSETVGAASVQGDIKEGTNQ